MKRLVLTDQAKADLRSLNQATRLRLAAALHRMAAANSGDIKNLQGVDPPEDRLRVGDYRVRFAYAESGEVRVDRIQNRKDAYR